MTSNAVNFNGSYSQDFNALAASGINNFWVNNSTLPGWYTSLSSYNSISPTSSSGGMYSFGSNQDRALGSVATDTTGNIYYGLRLVNSTNGSISSLRVIYRGEQWLNANNTSSQKLNFSYQTGTNLTNLSEGTWTSVTSLDFTGPRTGSTETFRDGNQTSNFRVINSVINLVTPLAVGEEIFLRWEDINNTGNDHALGIDDVQVLLPLAPFLTVSNNNTLSYTENAGLVIVDDTAQVQDTDSLNFNGGKLTVKFTSGASNDDILGIRNTPVYASQTGNISVGFLNGAYQAIYNFGSAGLLPIATFTPGVSAQPLEFTFNQLATPQAVQALMRSIVYGNISDNPTVGSRTLSFELIDDSRLKSQTATKTIQISAVNDSPVIAVPSKTFTLYNGSGTPNSQGFVYQTLPESPSGTFQNEGELISASEFDYAGYVAKPELMPILDRNVGYSVKFKLQVNEEERVQGADKNNDRIDDRAGFNVIVLGNDNKGIELGFWKDEIWTQNDGSAEPSGSNPTGTLFTHGEGTQFNTTTENTYELKVLGDNYSLFVNGGSTAILTGRLRDYTNFTVSPSLPLPTNPYLTPNFLFFGDNTPTARAFVKLGEISVTTGSTSGLSVNEDTNIFVRGLSINDVDSGDNNISVTLAVNNGTLRINTGIIGGVSNISNNGTGNVILTGTVEQINTTLANNAGLTYRGNQNFNGTDILTISTNGGFGSPVNQTVAITVNPINDAPVLGNISKSGLEDGTINFSASDFTDKFNDVEGNTLTKIRISSLPQNGTLKFDGINVTLNQEIDVANIPKLTFTPAANYKGTTTFRWNGYDGASYSATNATVSLTINPDGSNRWEVIATGNFDNDGKQDILQRNFSTGGVRFANPDGNPVVLQPNMGINWSVISTADFTGDSRADILWRNMITGENRIWEMNDTNIVSDNATFRGTSTRTGADLNWQVVSTADFNGDRRADILWRHVSTGETIVWEMNGANIVSFSTTFRDTNTRTIASNNWQIVSTADFNGDRRADILWRHVSTGETVVWQMDGANIVSSSTTYRDINTRTIASNSWQVISTADFNKDSRADILWRHASTGETIVWQMDGAKVVNFSSTKSNNQRLIQGTSWQVISTADFNNDGNADILWRNTTTGEVRLWQMDLANLANIVVNSAIGKAPTVEWQLFRATDFYWDSKVDSLWVNSSSNQAKIVQINTSTFGDEIIV